MTTAVISSCTARAAVIALALLTTASALSAQDTVLVNGLPLGSGLLNESLAAPFWRELAAVQCAPTKWSPDFGDPLGFNRSLTPLRLRLRAETGSYYAPAGFAGLRTILRSTSRYTIERIHFTDRLPGSVSIAYLVIPSGELEKNGPAVVLLHGSGMHPQEALGWPDEYRKGERFLKSTFVGAALDLAEAGYVVMVPWIGDDEVSSYWPRLQWQFTERAGESLRAKTRSVGAYNFLVNQVAGAVDFLGSVAGVDTARIAVAGWAEGATLAAMAAAGDSRIAATIRLEAPLDRASLRHSVDGTLAEAQFTHADCALGDVELAALSAPRPLLFAWADDDQSVKRFARYQSRAVVDSIRTAYRVFSAPPHAVTAHAAATWTSHDRRFVRAWLDSAFQFQPRLVPDSIVATNRPAREAYHSFDSDSLRVARRLFASGLGSCVSPSFTPNFSSRAAFTTGAGQLRRVVARSLGVTLPIDAPVTMLRRSVVLSTPTYQLEFITARSSRTRLPIQGLLATPVGESVRRLPVVLSLDGNVDLGQPLGLPVEEKVPYLNAYALDLVNAGSIVFIPYLPEEFPEIAAAELKARGLRERTSMEFVLPLHFAEIDLLRSLANVDTSRVTVRGISYAGIAALYVAGLDTRVTTLVYSNPVITAKVLYQDAASAALAAWWPEVCGTIDQLQTYLIAPRRFVRENGIRDINGYEDSPLETIDWVREVYERLGVANQFQFVRHDAGHETRTLDIPPLDF